MPRTRRLTRLVLETIAGTTPTTLQAKAGAVSG